MKTDQRKNCGGQEENVKGEKAAIYGLAVSKDDPILSITKDSYLKQF